MRKYLISKKGDVEEFVKMALWILVFVALSTGLYFLIKNIAGTI